MNPIIIRKEIENKRIIKNVFLPTSHEWESTETLNLSVWESGAKKLLFERIIDLIKDAKEIICLQSFLIQDTKIIDSLLTVSKRGVKVYVMDSAQARLANKSFEEEEHFSVTDYKCMLNEKFRHNFVHRQAGNFHAKFILIDPNTRQAKGVLFTGNFNKKPFDKNPELGIELSQSQVEELFQVFVYHFWEYATHEQTATEEFVKLEGVNNFRRPELQEALVTSPDKNLSNLKKTLLEQIKKAKESILFSTFGFDISNDVSKAILDKLEKGIAITVFCRPREKAINGNIDVLASKGAQVFCHPEIHAKSIVIDKFWGAIFSANFEKYGMDESFEVGMQLSANQKDDLLEIYQKWELTFPYKFKHEEIYANLPHNYSQLKRDGFKSFVTLPSDKKSILKKTVSNLNELIAFVEQGIKPIQSNARKIIQEKEIKFKLLNIESSIFLQNEPIEKGVNLVTYEERIKQKKNEEIITHEVLLFDNVITDQDLEILVSQLKVRKLENYKIYMN